MWLLTLLRRLTARTRGIQGGSDADVPLDGLEFVAIDIETTGLDPRIDVPVAMAAIPFVGGEPKLTAGYTRLVNPGRPIPPESQAIHGIGDDDVRDAPTPAAALAGFLETCGGHPLVAHTASFDLAILARVARPSGLRVPDGAVLDIGVMAHALFPSWWDLSLEGLGRLVEVQTVDRHSARGDAITAGLIFMKMVPLLAQQGIRSLDAAVRLHHRAALLPGGPGATGGGLSGP